MRGRLLLTAFAGLVAISITSIWFTNVETEDRAPDAPDALDDSGLTLRYGCENENISLEVSDIIQHPPKYGHDDHLSRLIDEGRCELLDTVAKGYRYRIEKAFVLDVPAGTFHGQWVTVTQPGNELSRELAILDDDLNALDARGSL